MVYCALMCIIFGSNYSIAIESKNIAVFSVVMVTLLYHRSFVVIPLLPGNSDALNQSHLRNFLAYIIIVFTQSS